MDPQKIKETVQKLQTFVNTNEMQELKINNNELFKYRIETEFTEFSQSYPTIVKKIMLGDNLKYLDKMIDAMASINNKKSTREDVEKTLGEELAEEFIYPLVNDKKK